MHVPSILYTQLKIIFMIQHWRVFSHKTTSSHIKPKVMVRTWWNAHSWKICSLGNEHIMKAPRHVEQFCRNPEECSSSFSCAPYCNEAWIVNILRQHWITRSQHIAIALTLSGHATLLQLRALASQWSSVQHEQLASCGRILCAVCSDLETLELIKCTLER